jgi:general secretion pathway protein F
MRRRFRFQAIDANGARIADDVYADDRGDALKRVASTHSAIIDLREVTPEAAGWKIELGPKITAQERIMALKQLAVMSKAGIDLLEALDITAASFPGRLLSAALGETILRLRQGEALWRALERTVPGFPDYVYALIKAGESSGRLGSVLEEAARQMEYEGRVRADLTNALIYPAFLVGSGMIGIGFLFYVVVPRFSEMLRNAHAQLHGLSALVIATGDVFSAHAPAILAALLIGVLAASGAARTKQGKLVLSDLANATPGIRFLIATRGRAGWARIMSIALYAGVGILEAAALASTSLPEGRQRARSLQSIQLLRSGLPIDEAFTRAGALAPVDASLVRAGQRSGALAEMFRAVADRNEDLMRDALKRTTLLAEPIAIGLVASIIGTVVIGLVSALTSIYESIG